MRISIPKDALRESQAFNVKAVQVFELRGPGGLVTMNLTKRSKGCKKNGRQRIQMRYVLRHYFSRHDVFHAQRVIARDIGKETGDLLIELQKLKPGLAFSWCVRIAQSGSVSSDAFKALLAELLDARLKYSKHRQPEQCDDVDPTFVRVTQTS